MRLPAGNTQVAFSQVYGCKDCKRRFTLGDDEKARVPAKAIATFQSRILELEEANRTLLDNNVKLAAENTRLSAMTTNQHSRILALDKEKQDCKLKCELVVKEKDHKIRVLEEYKAGCKSIFERLKHGKWFYSVKQNPDFSIDIIHTVYPA